MFRYVLSLIVFHLFVFSSFEQELHRYEYHALSGEEFQELPDHTIYSVTEDSTGILWLSTSLGLYQFDGYNFSLVRSPVKKGRAVFEFKVEGPKVFFSNVYGQLFEASKDTLKLISDVSDYSNGSVPKYVKHQGRFYIGTKSGLFSLNDSVNKLLSGEYILGLTAQNNNILYVNDEGLLKFVDQDGTIRTSENLMENAQQINHLSFSEGEAQLRLLFYKLDGVNRFKLFDHKERGISLNLPKALSRITINHVYIEKDSLLSFIVSTEQGCYRIQYPQQGTTPKLEMLLSADYNCTSALKERGGDLLVATMNNGFFILPNQQIKHLNISGGDEVEAFTVLNNKTYATGSIDGLLRIYEEGNLSKQIQLPNHSKIEKIVFLRSANVLLINTNGNFGYIYHLERNKFTENKRLVATKDIFPLSDSLILHATFDRLSLLNLWKEDGEKELINSRTMRIVHDSKAKRFYAATLKGVYAFGDELNSFTKIKSNDKTILLDLEIVNDKVLGFSDNRLYSIKDESLHLITEFNGVIKDIKGDNENNTIWLNTTMGIISFDLTTREHFILPLSKDLLKEINELEFKDSTLYFSDRKALYVFKNNNIARNKDLDFKPTLNLLEINGESKSFQKNYNLNYNQSNIRLEFGVNRYNSSKSMTYYYKLKRAGDESGAWLKLPGGINYIQLTNLAADDYTVLAYAQTKAGNKSEVAKLVRFSVSPPYWQRWWFFLIIAIFTILLVAIAIQKWLSIREKRKNEELSLALYKQRTALLQLENLRSQMNPHFIFNALNSIQDYIVLNERKLASSFLVKFSRLIRIYLEQGQQNEISLKQEIEALRLYLELEKVRFEDELTYEIVVDNKLVLTTIKIPSLLLQPYIENALKHGLLHKKLNRSLSVRFSLKSSKLLECIIEDNGVGRAASRDINLSRKGHVSFATQATEKRVELINEVKCNNDKIQIKIYDLFSAAGKPNGTRVNILIPFK